MRDTITISIPKKFKRQIDRIVHQEGISRSEIVRESLAEYLWEHQYEGLRARMVKKAAKMGVYTDEDVFKIVS